MYGNLSPLLLRYNSYNSYTHHYILFMMSLFQMKYNTQNFADRLEDYLTQNPIHTLTQWPTF